MRYIRNRKCAQGNKNYVFLYICDFIQISSTLLYLLIYSLLNTMENTNINHTDIDYENLLKDNSSIDDESFHKTNLRGKETYKERKQG